MNNVTVNGGSAKGAGGKGRIAIYYYNSFSGNFTPGYLRDMNIADTPTPTLTPSQTPTITPTSTPAPSGWQIRDYTYDANHPHAVESVISEQSTVGSYVYDENGNMTCRMENGEWFVQEYNSENRISSIMKLAEGTCENVVKLATKWDFAYDGDGVRVATLTTPYDGNGDPQTASWTTYFFGGAYEVRSDSTTIKYYSFAGQMVAMNECTPQGCGTGLQYFLTDHLGSVVATTDSTGTLTSQQRYLPFGGVRPNVPSPDAPATDFGYTGQRNLDSGIGLMDYKARFYSPYINRFIQPDSVVPDLSNPQSLNRFSYVRNNPLIYIDPTGHTECRLEPEECKYLQNLKNNSTGGNSSSSSSGNKLDFTGYSDWEKEVLLKLNNEGGANAQHGVRYILENKIHIKVGTGWQALGGATGAWFDEKSNTITLNSDVEAGSADANGNPTLWGLSLIVHEARHLEQGSQLSHSKLGEMDAWQIQLQVYQILGGNLSEGQTRIMNAPTLNDFKPLIQKYYPEYWSRPGSGIGLNTYPDYPDLCWGTSEACKNYVYKPWWMRPGQP